MCVKESSIAYPYLLSLNIACILHPQLRILICCTALMKRKIKYTSKRAGENFGLKSYPVLKYITEIKFSNVFKPRFPHEICREMLENNQNNYTLPNIFLTFMLNLIFFIQKIILKYVL